MVTSIHRLTPQSCVNHTASRVACGTHLRWALQSRWLELGRQVVNHRSSLASLQPANQTRRLQLRTSSLLHTSASVEHRDNTLFTDRKNGQLIRVMQTGMRTELVTSTCCGGLGLSHGGGQCSLSHDSVHIAVVLKQEVDRRLPHSTV